MDLCWQTTDRKWITYWRSSCLKISKTGASGLKNSVKVGQSEKETQACLIHFLWTSSISCTFRYPPLSGSPDSSSPCLSCINHTDSPTIHHLIFPVSLNGLRI
ncbi:unnamed protein product [Rangifer tarandus platyrhynchus]|uniref:Uncharacterized protein n=1 Tax=Rangifer tarandus platyrhynchus TaxID=3082113 RepID=A0AC59YZY9_RANTA